MNRCQWGANYWLIKILKMNMIFFFCNLVQNYLAVWKYKHLYVKNKSQGNLFLVLSIFLIYCNTRVGGFRRLGVSCVKMVRDECLPSLASHPLEISIILLIDYAPTSPFLFVIPAISLAGLESKCTRSIDVNGNSVILSAYLI